MKGPAKKSWEEYHVSYGENVTRFVLNNREPFKIGEVPTPLAKAYAVKFSRYVSALWKEARVNEIAKQYHMAANQIICRCIPNPDRPGFSVIEFNLDPGVAADEAFMAAEQVQREKAKAAE